ncbi:type II toxin-antitoxin system HicA family toxin [Streptococcus macacae]|uniref:YcfA-like protein n=1 Tax=Streptococcus macacae NCTC 11558 TaxID=764298 RepID=G5JUM3_9STRE|nr:type II toxin-antitoxin system HicA family toxin [Streptococcus macacae]EHJ51659.1 YcfA-like protein [Streptococcus macacae NCTC 11558]SUN78664.1 toxin-antitoxin system, HicA family protein [Streptococcus macacae NCTC 11558]
MPLTGKELAKLAEKNGWKEVRVKGSHHHFKKDRVPYIVTIPIHGNQSVKIGLEKKILKDLGLL